MVVVVVSSSDGVRNKFSLPSLGKELLLNKKMRFHSFPSLEVVLRTVGLDVEILIPLFATFH
jgi:hypothetical protein